MRQYKTIGALMIIGAVAFVHSLHNPDHHF